MDRSIRDSEDQLLPRLREEYQGEAQKLQALKKIEAMFMRRDGKEKGDSAQVQKLAAVIPEQQDLVSSP